MTAALLEVPSRAAEVLENDAAIQAIARAGRRRRATCCSSGAAIAFRSRWKAR